MGAREVEAFAAWLAVAGRVAASTQNQAKSAPCFFTAITSTGGAK